MAGRPMSGGTRYRARRVIARRPVVPRESSRQAELLPVRDPNTFDWIPGEVALGIRKTKRIGVMERLQKLYAPSKPDGGAE
jgi:hypothetical protein